MTEQSIFQNPPRHFATNLIVHNWGDSPAALMQAIKDYGYGGVVTNVPFANGFAQNPANVATFSEITKALTDKGLSYWIYDEPGYPSGRGGGEVLREHMELAAKGLYMHRRIAYHPKNVAFRLDDESDKIVWAAKYPLDIPRKDESFVKFDDMEPVSFSATEVNCTLQEREVLYIFCVKTACDGSHSTHNMSSFEPNLNVMSREGVRRFLDICFEPIAANAPEAYSTAVNVFTDEPSLHVGYARDYETWPYALAPWVDGLFEEYETRYGESLLPYLPLIFENGQGAAAVRVKFYELIGRLIAENYTRQIADWCHAHGCGFSGHYLAEEDMAAHVRQYGNYVRVLCEASLPGADILCCFPEIFNINTVKFTQMAVRKNGHSGMMIELCPFAEIDEFNKAPLLNMTAVAGMLFLGGVRVCNSYFFADFSKWGNGELATHTGYTNEEESRRFNRYIARMGYMLDGVQNATGVLIYYGIESVQAAILPQNRGGVCSGEEITAGATAALSSAIFAAGQDFYYVDADDITAVDTDQNGVPALNGCPVKIILIPRAAVMYRRTVEALRRLQAAGVQVKFVDSLPTTAAEDAMPLDVSGFDTVTVKEAVALATAAEPFPFEEAPLKRGRFERPDETVFMLVNATRETVETRYTGAANAMLWCTANGTVAPLLQGDILTVPPSHTVFVTVAKS